MQFVSSEGFELVYGVPVEAPYSDAALYVVRTEAGRLSTAEIEQRGRLIDPMSSTFIFDPNNPESETITLYGQLSKLDDSDFSAVVCFAGKYGFLDAPQPIYAAGATKPIYGELLDVWLRTIRELRIVRRVHEDTFLPERQAEVELSRFIKPIKHHNDTSFLHMSYPSTEYLTLIDPAEQEALERPIGAPPPDNDWGIASLEPDELAEASFSQKALALIAKVINERLIGHTTTTANYDLQQGIVLNYGPTTLRGALWLGLSYALKNIRGYFVCPVCGRTTAISKQRADKRTCSNACRQKAQRERDKSRPAKN